MISKKPVPVPIGRWIPVFGKDQLTRRRHLARSEEAIDRNGKRSFRTNQRVKAAHKGVYARLKTEYGRREAVQP